MDDAAAARANPFRRLVNEPLCANEFDPVAGDVHNARLWGDGWWLYVQVAKYLSGSLTKWSLWHIGQDSEGV